MNASSSASRYAFYLLRSEAVGNGGNDGTVTLADIVKDDPTDTIVQACLFNMMIDWPFLLEEVPALGRIPGDRLTVISGQGMLYGNLPPASLCYFPALPQYGNHHSKGMLIWRQDQSGDKTLTVVVTTANFIHSDIKVKSNGVWYAKVPAKDEARSASQSPLEFDLITYFEQYNIRHQLSTASGATSQHGSQPKDGGRYRSCATVPLPWTRKDADFALQYFDFSDLRGIRLIGSAPGPPPMNAGGEGTRSARDHGAHTNLEQFGHMKLRNVIRQLVDEGLVPRVGNSTSSSSSSSSSNSTADCTAEQRHLICQATSSYNFDEKTLCLQVGYIFVNFYDLLLKLICTFAFEVRR